MEPLSVVIITFNEEKNISRCIHSIKQIAKEIVVVDSFSTDRTPEICKEHGVHFIQNPFAGHIEQKNFALDQSCYNLVLSLDADEACDDQLVEEIKQILEGPTHHRADGYYFNRLNNYAGRWIYHCGWYPDQKLRLFDKTKGLWGGVNPHDIVKMKEGTKIKKLNGNLLHYTYSSIHDHVEQTNKFTSIAAQAAFSKGVRSNWFKILTRPPLKFLRDYLFKKGFLDGKFGFYICVINALSAFLKYSKLKEIQTKES